MLIAAPISLWDIATAEVQKGRSSSCSADTKVRSCALFQVLVESRSGKIINVTWRPGCSASAESKSKTWYIERESLTTYRKLESSTMRSEQQICALLSTRLPGTQSLENLRSVSWRCSISGRAGVLKHHRPERVRLASGSTIPRVWSTHTSQDYSLRYNTSRPLSNVSNPPPHPSPPHCRSEVAELSSSAETLAEPID